MMMKLVIYIGVELLKIKIMFLYIGPGLGGGVIAIITGLFITIFSFLVAVFWIPLKKLFNKLFKKK